MEAQLKEELVKAANSIRKKYRLLREGITEEEEEANKRFEPLLKPLTTLIDLTTGPQKKTDEETTSEPPGISIKTEKKLKRKIAPKKEKTKKGQKVKRPKFVPIPEDVFESADDAEETEESDEEWQEYLKSYGPLAREYLTGLLADSAKPYKNQRFDRTFGIRNLGTGKWGLGNKNVEFDKEDKIHVGDKAWWSGTRGLYELLFKKLPGIHTRRDEASYKQILEYANAHLQGYDPKAKIASSASSKYRTIISKLFPRPISTKKATGEGLVPVTENRVEHIYWTDPNDLVSELALRKASEAAGHTGLGQEIASLEKTLRDAKYIV